MLEAQAVPVLISLLGAYPRAADLLCILAKEKECKEAFLDQSALKALVDSLHIEITGMFGHHSCSHMHKHSATVRAVYVCVHVCMNRTLSVGPQLVLRTSNMKRKKEALLGSSVPVHVLCV